MKKLLIGGVLLALVSAACAPQTSTEPAPVITDKPEEPTEQDVDPVVDVVMEQLAENRGLKIDEISLVSNKSVEFSDGCLDIPMQDVMCAQVITPGQVVVLEVNEIQYEYHVSEDGPRIQPATFALTWSRDGGFAGFCDRLTVFLSGEVYGDQCKSQDSRMGTFASLLSASEINQLDAWVSDYGQVTLDASDPKGVSDQMSLIIEFFGKGKGKPGKPVEGEIFLWAQELYQKLYQDPYK